MTLSRALVRLYPEAFRDRWGAALECEAREAGWKSWPNLALGIADMWLHPAVWPARSRAQRHGRAAVMAITVTAACWLLTHAAAELDGPSGIARGRAVNACVATMLLGLALVAPRPRLTAEAVIALGRRAARLLAVPMCLGALVVAAAHVGGLASAGSPLRAALLICWWLALPLAAFQTCRVVAGLGADVAVPPPPRRLRAGVRTLAAAGATAGALLLTWSVSGGHPHPLSATAGAGLLLLSAAFATTLRDLRELRPDD
ncbi:hypothetical protein [Sphaerisporangium fuscum]|uniref:hypothetical protein n=1 Tax=Sphaerisporangium fuscum TaxID=2835868 RepID=UPI001BDBCDB3|nr:hypothetical protein [Sphaerisporangium fuscum]